MVKTVLNGLHKLHTIKILFICHELLGKSGFITPISRVRSNTDINTVFITPMTAIKMAITATPSRRKLLKKLALKAGANGLGYKIIPNAAREV